jgi:hypothetical protein
MPPTIAPTGVVVFVVTIGLLLDVTVEDGILRVVSTPELPPPALGVIRK